jgi:hypothetical protein
MYDSFCLIYVGSICLQLLMLLAAMSQRNNAFMQLQHVQRPAQYALQWPC